MFTEWMENLHRLVEDTYGDAEWPFDPLTNDDLRQKFEAGLSEQEALTQLAGEWSETDD